MEYEDRIRDPRAVLAKSLFDVSQLGQMQAGHAKFNVRYILSESVLGADSGYDDPQAALEDTVRQYIRADAQAGVLETLARIQRSVAARYPEVKRD